MTRAHSDLVIYITEEKFPNPSKMLEVIDKKQIRVSNFDKIHAE